VPEWYRGGLCVGFAMVFQDFAHVLALAVGIVSSGLVSNAWALVAGETPRLGDLLDPNPTPLTPFRVLAAIFSAPTTILLDGFWWLIAQPLFGILIIAAGLVWSFLQGVFILNQVFGFT
jgi:hypothetical protein